jgi:spoIIIJ-associated protein
VEYVEIEVRARTVDLAVEAAMQELGVTDREQISVEVVSEPVKGFLGMGGQDAVVRVKRRRNRRNRGGKRRGNERPDRTDQPQERNRQRGNARSAKNETTQRPSRSRDENQRGREQRKEKAVSDDRPVLPIEEQMRITQEFLEGLVDAYGLDGEVRVEVSEDVIVADVSGEQTEALVGVRGSVRSAIHELTRTVLQRYGQDSARLRLDIAGYAERRRQALSIYAEQLIEQLTSEGGEIMLEPMSPADRKVIHDVAAAHQGVTSYSEGEPPRRYVVLSYLSGSGEEE